MKRVLVVVLSFLSAALLSACASESPFTRSSNAFGPTFPVADDGKAALYIVRAPAPADAPPVNISSGRHPLGGLTGAKYMRLDLSPKLYDLRAYGTQTSNELVVTVAPGQTRFLLAQPTDTGGAELLELSQEQGRRLVRQSERIWTPELN
jgi:hypothetical protein